MSRPISDYVWGLHSNGVHSRCTAPVLRTGHHFAKLGDGTPRACPLAGKLERFHSHDHDGPLDCGCDDLA